MAGRQRANGEGSIRERYPGCWEGRYTAGYDILTGKRIQKGVFAKTRKECAAKLARAIQQDTGPYYRKGKGYDSQPLSTWIRLWFDSYTKPNLRPSSADGYRSMIENHIIPVLGHIQLSKLSSIQIQRFYNDLHTQGRLDNHGNRKYEPLSASTVKHIHAVLSGALKQAVKERIIPFNPCDNCKIPKREKKEMHVLPQDKIGAYLDEAKRLGVYAKTVAGMLGHYSAAFTLDTYTHVTEQMKRGAAEKIGVFMNASVNVQVNVVHSPSAVVRGDYESDLANCLNPSNSTDLDPTSQ